MLNRLVLLGAVLAIATGAYAEEKKKEKKPSITVNGEARGFCREMNDFRMEGEGVVVYVGDVAMFMEKADSYAFLTYPDKAGMLYMDVAGKKRLVGIRTAWSYKDDARVAIDPFAKLKPADMKYVRGVYLDAEVSAKALELLSHADAAKTFITFTDETKVGNTKAMPKIPNGIRFLTIQESSSMGIEDYGHLKTFTELRYFDFNSMTVGLDLALLAGNAKLEYLNAGGKQIANLNLLDKFSKLRVLEASGQDTADLSVIGKLTGLRVLNLDMCDKLTGIEFVKPLAELEDLSLWDTKVADLSPIGGLKKLTTVVATNSPVRRLPKGKMEHLKVLKVLGAKLDPKSVEAFRKTNPQCKVVFGWNDTLQQALSKTDRIRVRTGGTCHTDPAKEKTLFELKTAKEVKDFLTNLEVRPSRSGFHCMCCGSPTFEFYEGKTLLAALGFHHGRSMRWSRGEWPGDGLLSEKSGDFLCRILDKHGIKGPLKERNAESKRERAAKLKWQRQGQLLPDAVRAPLSEATSAGQAAKAFVVGEPDPGKRAILVLKLIGCDFSSWNRQSCLDSVLIPLLANKVASEFGPAASLSMTDVEKPIKTEHVIAAIEGNTKDAMVLRGGARWFFGERKYDDLPAKKAATILPLIAPLGLTHPRLTNRRRTMFALKKLNNEASLKILNRVLNGEFKTVALPEEEAEEPGGMVQFTGADGEVDDSCSEQVYAAFILASLGQKGVLPKLKKMHASETNPKSKKVLKTAIDLFENPKKEPVKPDKEAGDDLLEPDDKTKKVDGKW